MIHLLNLKLSNDHSNDKFITTICILKSRLGIIKSYTKYKNTNIYLIDKFSPRINLSSVVINYIQVFAVEY